MIYEDPLLLPETSSLNPKGKSSLVHWFPPFPFIPTNFPAIITIKDLFPAV